MAQTAALARQAAAILPAPPSADDREGSAGWTDLVVATAERLGALAGVPAVGLGGADVPRRVLTGPDLLALAGVATSAEPGRRPAGAARSRRASVGVALLHHRCPGMTRVV